MADPFNFESQLYEMIQYSDYEQQEVNANRIRSTVINATRRVICYDQAIYDDMRLEVAEYFGLTLRPNISGSSIDFINVQPMYDQAAILILDDDGNK